MRFSRQEYWGGVPLPSPSFHLLIPKFQSIPLPSPSNYTPTSPRPSHSFPLRPPGFQAGPNHGKLYRVSSFRTIPIRFPLSGSTDRDQSQEMTLMSLSKMRPLKEGREEGVSDQTASSSKSNGTYGYSLGPLYACQAYSAGTNDVDGAPGLQKMGERVESHQGAGKKEA